MKGTAWFTDMDYSILQRADSLTVSFGKGTGGVMTDIRPAVTISNSTWYFVCMVYDSVGQTLLARVNATESQVAHTTAVQNTTALLQIGRSTQNGQFFGGQIDAFGFWSRVLTQAERNELYNNGSGKQYPFA